MARYEVLENGEPASYHRYTGKDEFLERGMKRHGWTEYQFSSWEQAQAHASNWLGPYDRILIPNIPEDYNGYGDIIEIREIE
jgi:hypothetical protein